MIILFTRLLHFILRQCRSYIQVVILYPKVLAIFQLKNGPPGGLLIAHPDLLLILDLTQMIDLVNILLHRLIMVDFI